MNTHKNKDADIALWECKYCGLYNYPVQTQCKACFYYNINKKSSRKSNSIHSTKSQHSSYYGLFSVDDSASTVIKKCNQNTNNNTTSSQLIAYLQQSEIWYWSLRTQIDSGLARYYHHKGATYKCNDIGNGQFIEWCYLNHYDSDTILYELQITPTICSLVEFDIHFPIDPINLSRQYEIFNVIKCCAINPYAFMNSVEITLNKQTQIDCALGRYYKHNVNQTQYFDNNGIGKFKEWCEANGYDTESIEGDLELGPSEGCMVEFDSNIPTTRHNTFDIIMRCWKNPFAYIKDKTDNATNKYSGTIYRVGQIVYVIKKFGYSDYVITDTLNTYFKNKWRYNSAVIIKHFSEGHMDYIIKYIQKNYKPILKPFDDNIQSEFMSTLQQQFKSKSLSFMCETKVINVIECYIRIATKDGISLPYDVVKICCGFCNCLNYYPNDINWSSKTSPNIKNSNQHIFDYKVSLNNPIITGKSDVLYINVMFDVILENTSWNVQEDDTPKISNASDIVLNIYGNLKIGQNGSIIASHGGSIFINVRGDIELKSTGKIKCTLGSGNIYIKCKNLKIGAYATINTCTLTNKYGGDAYIQVANKFDFEGKISSKNLKINCHSFKTIYWNKFIDSATNITINAHKWIATYRMLRHAIVTASIQDKLRFRYNTFQIKL